MNLICQLALCYGSFLVSPEDKNQVLIIEQIITQIATNREALIVDRNAINRLLYENDRLTADLLNLQNKIIVLEKELKPPTEEEVEVAMLDKFSTKLVRNLVRSIGVNKSLCLMTVFINDNNDQKVKKQQLAFEASVKIKLLKQRSLNNQEAVRLHELARGDLELVLDNFQTDVVVFLVIEQDFEDSFMDMWFKELAGNVVIPPSIPATKIKQAPAPVRAPAPAPAPAQASANFRFFYRR